MMLAFFRALADASRLRIVGLLAQESLSVEQLAEMLDLSPSTISHHLARLAEAGLVTARAESYYNIYQLEPAALEEMAHRLLSVDSLAAAAAGVDMNAYDQKIWRDYQGADGRLKSIPTQRKKLEAILNRVVGDFETGKTYSEQEVNRILGHYHADTALLRRELVGYDLLRRDRRGTEYWRPVNPDELPASQ